jgi:hypothetical protein
LFEKLVLVVNREPETQMRALRLIGQSAVLLKGSVQKHEVGFDRAGLSPHEAHEIARCRIGAD